MNVGDIVYVRWYGKVVEGKLLDGEYLGMKQVQIPLDGRKVIALFTTQHIYQDAADAMAVSPTVDTPIQRVILSTEYPSGDFFYQQLQEFKEAHWDHEHNHLQVEAWDEYCELWRLYAQDRYINHPEHPFIPEWNGWNNGIKEPSIGETINKAIKELKEIVTSEPVPQNDAPSEKPKKRNPAVTQLSLFD